MLIYYFCFCLFLECTISVKTKSFTLINISTCLKTMVHENEADRKQGKPQLKESISWSSETEYLFDKKKISTNTLSSE